MCAFRSWRNVRRVCFRGGKGVEKKLSMVRMRIAEPLLRSAIRVNTDCGKVFFNGFSTSNARALNGSSG